MSFFLEPPPLDSDLPPPLDDKLRENDFDLEDEEAVEDSRIDDPELPTDFNVFSLAATDESFTYGLHQPPPDFSPFALSESPPEDKHSSAETNFDLSESPAKHDVAKEKESIMIDEVVSQPVNDQTRSADTVIHEVVSVSESVVGEVSVARDNDGEIPSQRTSVDFDSEEIPAQESVVQLEDMKSSDKGDEIEQLPVETPALNVNELPVTRICSVEPEIRLDDEFDDFVEAAPSVVDAIKTEETLGSSDLDEFSAFSTHVKPNLDIPEPIPELRLDDIEGDDDFNDFETAIPANRQVEQVKSVEANSVEPKASEMEFVADFSSFDAFSETKVESTFDEFQDFKTAGFESVNHAPQFDDDDDDFGDFSDFTQAPAASVTVAQPQQVETLTVTKPTNVDGLLDIMFPPKGSETLQETSATSSTDGGFAREQLAIKSDNFVNKFNDFDATLALGYLYNNSRSSRTLVKALGIDTRNILQGPQWASSFSANPSNMPRFATNLSFNPIEPIKPSSTATKTPTEAPQAILQPTKAPSEVVPEVEFDWNSSGLVNPLDGPQSKPPQPHCPEPIVTQQQPATAAPSAHPFENEPPLYGVDQEITQVLEAETKANTGHKPELSDISAYQWSTEVGSQNQADGPFGPPAPNSNLVVRERTIKLPETHIFTPVKGTSPVAREVISRDTSPSPDFKGPITVKEYHDVEYSLEPKKKFETDVDFDEFQSAQPTIVTPGPPLVPLAVLEPQKLEKPSTEIKWPEPGSVAQTTSSDLDFLAKPTPPIQKPSFTLPLAAPTIAPLVQPPPPLVIKRKESGYLKPVIGTSPTQLNGDPEEDDFNDFQTAPQSIAPVQIIPTAAPPQQKAQSNDPITLSPARLAASQPLNQKSMWISSMDNDEINRIEAAFPKCKPEKKEVQLIKHDDEDDWTDFVGASQPSSLPFSQSQPPSMISSNSISSNPPRVSNGDVDDWSDFVSVPVAKVPSAKPGASSSQFISKPNFSSWNQPSRPYVNHTTSFLTSDTGRPSQQYTSTNYPYVTDKMPRNSMTIHNNFNYGFGHSEDHSGTGPSIGGQRQPKPNGISTILPELDFAMPKNLINLPRSGQLDPGKK